MAKTPKVFISYSHDSPEHKRWVSELAVRLRHNGIDAILDQWDLGPGDDITLFMESGLKNSDRVLVICTDTYVSKANAGEGGVGYERMIVTAELIQNLGTNKFIPVIRQASGEEKTPTFLGTRVFIDFTAESQFDAEFEKLLHELHREPIIKKPPLGKSPFATLPSGQEIPPAEGVEMHLPEIPEQVESALDTYSLAVKMARLGDEVGFRLLFQQIQPRVFECVAQWRNDKLDGQRPNYSSLFEVVDKAVDFVSPLFSVALAGIKCGREQFRDQKLLFNRLRNIVGWNPHGNKAWAEIPDALGMYIIVCTGVCVYARINSTLLLVLHELIFLSRMAQITFFYGKAVSSWGGLIRLVTVVQKAGSTYQQLIKDGTGWLQFSGVN